MVLYSSKAHPLAKQPRKIIVCKLNRNTPISENAAGILSRMMISPSIHTLFFFNWLIPARECPIRFGSLPGLSIGLITIRSPDTHLKFHKKKYWNPDLLPLKQTDDGGRGPWKNRMKRSSGSLSDNPNISGERQQKGFPKQ